jgi:hypothetical protein
MAKRKRNGKKRPKKSSPHPKPKISKRTKGTRRKPIEQIKAKGKRIQSKPVPKVRSKVHRNKKTTTNKTTKHKVKRSVPTKPFKEILRPSTEVRKSSIKNINPAKVSRKRGAKIISFKFTAKNLENKIDQFNKGTIIADAELNKLQTKDRPKGAKSYRQPKGVIIIVKGKNGEGELAFPSPPDFVVNKTNVKAFANGVMEKAVGSIYKRSDRKNRKNLWVSKSKKKFDVSGEPIDPTQISELLIRYIYHTPK